MQSEKGGVVRLRLPLVLHIRCPLHAAVLEQETRVQLFGPTGRLLEAAGA